MKLNRKIKSDPQYTHEGGKAGRQTPEQELRRAVSTCLLWEDTFYERGSSIGIRIGELCKKVKPEVVASLAREARTEMKLRHVPLWLGLQLVYNHSHLAKDVIADVVQRPDEMGELLSIYWMDGRKPLAAQLKKGLAKAFPKFNAYNLAKWNRDSEIKLKDVMFLTHPKPRDNEQATVWKQLIAGTLESPDTWEVALSAGKDKRTTWERLLKEDKLGDMALLMNLRNMVQVGVDERLIGDTLIKKAGTSKALPFRYVSALRAAPSLAGPLDTAMKASLPEGKTLKGRTAFLVDVSGSMDATLSGKSLLSGIDGASALGIILANACEHFRLFTFSERVCEVPAIASLLVLNSISASQPHHGTHLRAALHTLESQMKGLDRVIVVTDEQSHDGIHPAWTDKAYLINVANYQPGLDIHSGWTRISGWSERVVEWMRANECDL